MTDNKGIKFIIKDQGIGIPYEEIKYLLEPFIVLLIEEP
jgi:signal transduction histidine kinase